MTDPVQPLRDQPREVLVGKVFTRRSDCFSFGVMAWAAMNATKPWPSMSAAEAARAHVNGRRMAAPEGPFADATLYTVVVVKCWQQREVERLEMARAAELLDSRVAELLAVAAKDPQAAGPSVVAGGTRQGDGDGNEDEENMDEYDELQYD